MPEDHPYDAGYTIRTERLILRLADPLKLTDCEQIVTLYSDAESGKGGQRQVGMSNVEDVWRKHDLMGPKARFCILAPPPRGMYLLTFLPNSNGEEETLIGHVGISFRPGMPHPDLGWALFGPYQGKGYATEAGRAALRFWRDTIGVKEIFAGTLADNEKSQRCAERIGFVRGGTLTVLFGHAPDEKSMESVAFVLPGMKWTEGMKVWPTVGRGTMGNHEIDQNG